MTDAEYVEQEILACPGNLVSLTRIVVMRLPARLDFLGFDEIAFVYKDGSRFVTCLYSDDEFMEAWVLRRLIMYADNPPVV
jgi:hypothetical protein